MSGAIERVRSVPANLGSRLRAEDGFTLTELAVVSMMALIAFAVAMVFYLAVVSRTEDTQARADTQSSQQVAIERIARDVREGDSLEVGMDGRTLLISGVVGPSGANAVRYECGSPRPTGTCWRQELTATGAAVGPGTELIANVDPESEVFTLGSDYDPGNAGYVTITLTSLPEGRDRPITLERGVALRCVNSTLDAECFS